MEEQLTSVRNVNLRDLRLLVASTALVRILGKPGLTDEPADVANEDAVLVRDVHCALLQESGSTVRDHAVTLHFAEAKTTVSGSSFGWLSRQYLYWPSSSGMHLVSDQMLQSLVVGGPKEDEYLQLLASKSVVHHLVAISLVAEGVEFCGDV